jgi:beta-phosphoglucomutase-like phosphatase (HAD superfamily)
MILKSSQSPPQIQAILWDMDGTLLDTETLSDQSIFEALKIPQPKREELNYRLPWDIKEPTLGKRGDEWVPMVIDYAVKHNWGVSDPPPHWKDLWEVQEEILNSYCSRVEECRGASQVVSTLASDAGVPQCIATSSRVVSVEKKRTRHHDIFQHMKLIVTGEEVKHPKPAPDIYLEAASRMQVPIQNCMVFEDSIAGCQSARAAGCGAVIAVPDSRGDPSKFDGIADQVLRDLTEFDAKAWGLLN